MVIPKYLNSSTLLKELLSILILWLRPTFWSWDMTMYLVFISTDFWSTLLTSHYQSLCVFLYSCTLPPTILTSSAQIRSQCVPFNFKPSWFTWTLLMAYCMPKLNSNGNRASPCFRPFLVGNMSDKFLPAQTLRTWKKASQSARINV